MTIILIGYIEYILKRKVSLIFKSSIIAEEYCKEMKFFPICEFNYISNMAQANFKKLGEIDHFGSIRSITLLSKDACAHLQSAHARARARGSTGPL